MEGLNKHRQSTRNTQQTQAQFNYLPYLLGRYLQWQMLLLFLHSVSDYGTPSPHKREQSTLSQIFLHFLKLRLHLTLWTYTGETLPSFSWWISTVSFGLNIRKEIASSSFGGAPKLGWARKWPQFLCGAESTNKKRGRTGKRRGDKNRHIGKGNKMSEWGITSRDGETPSECTCPLSPGEQPIDSSIHNIRSRR